MTRFFTPAVALLACALAFGAQLTAQDTLTPLQQLGKTLFFDDRLSSPPGQSCATCHDPVVAFADPRTEFATSAGVLPGRFGNRNSPMAAYAAIVPPLEARGMDSGGMGMGGGSMGGGMDGGGMDGGEMDNPWVGGLFWDGRASTLEDQAQGPFVNPLEMHSPNKKLVVRKVRESDYAGLFFEVFGAGAFDDDEAAYARIAQAIAEYERTSAFVPYSSRFDRWARSEGSLTPQELRGLSLFEGKGKCNHCHPTRSMGMMQPAGMMDEGMAPNGMQGGGGMDRKRYQRLPLTGFRYRNIGLPKNPLNPFYTLPPALNPQGADAVDLGLGPTVNDPRQNGKFRVPSLRNVTLTPPYGHNGYFATLKEMVHFINTRDVESYPAPEVPETVIRHPAGMPIPPPGSGVFGNFQLTDAEEDDIIAFLGTLADQR
jgi:cytochrome c peroxidase